MNSNELKAGPELYQKVRGGLIARGTTLSAWCREYGYNPTNARSALVGGWNGPKGKALRQRLAEEAGIASSTSGVSKAQRMEA